jgi:hypothetical protein
MGTADAADAADAAGATVSERIVAFGVCVGLQIGMPRKHWNFVGSQHPVIEEGSGRGVGLDVNDELKLKRCVGLGVLDSLGLQRGASEGQSKSVGSQQ